MPTPRRNVLLIVTDQQRFDSLGCTGHPTVHTPHLDRLAQNGALFTRHFTANPVCMPSRASTLTGCYPSVHGVWTNGVALPRAEYTPINDQTQAVLQNHWTDPAQTPPIPSHLLTLADAFAAAGHRTSAFGKLHVTPTMSDASLGFPESKQRWQADPAMADWHGPYYGFEHVELSLDHGPMVGGHYTAWLEKHHPEMAATVTRELSEAPRPTPLGDLYVSSHTRQTHPTSWVADRVCDRIAQHAGADEPFLIWAGIPDPHHPFTPPRELAEAYEQHDTPQRAADPETMGDEPRWVTHARGGADLIDAATSRRARQYTDAMVHLIDEAVGRMLDALDAAGLADDTVVVFTADHGDYLGDYGLIRKTIYPARVLSHTPLIVRDPSGSLSGTIACPASNTDLLPTLAGLAGIDVPTGVQGEDLRRVVAEGRGLPVMIQSANGLPSATSLTTIDQTHRTTWWPGTGKLDSFDHRTDPMELDNLGERDKDPSVNERLGQLQAAYGRSVRPTVGRVACW
ncbi:MAG: sulfatase-like hydrolase/transferase [Planctomycetota bacterium]